MNKLSLPSVFTHREICMTYSHSSDSSGRISFLVYDDWSGLSLTLECMLLKAEKWTLPSRMSCLVT